MDHNGNNTHIIPYRTFLIVLVVLIVLTLLSVELTTFHFGALTVFVALLVAVIKSSLVMSFFMHLKLESRLLQALTIGVSVLILFVIIGTMADYIFR